MSAEKASFDTPLDPTKLLFVQGSPERFTEVLPEIKRLRERHYTHNEDFSGRSTAQKLRFAGRMTDETWVDPAKITGTNRGQRHRSVQVVAALDRQTGEVKGYAKSELNDSSKYERKLGKFWPLRPLARVVGRMERAHKQRKDPSAYTYVKLSETVRDTDQPPKLESLLGALALKAQVDENPYLKKGTIYLHEDQEQLKQTTAAWGYAHDGNEPQPSQAFGPEPNDITHVERHVTNDLSGSIAKMLHIAGVLIPPVTPLGGDLAG